MSDRGIIQNNCDLHSVLRCHLIAINEALIDTDIGKLIVMFGRN